jgi:hypothetical protein
MKFDLDQEKLAWLLENTQYEFRIWCWSLALMLALAVVLIARDSRRSRRRRDDVLHYGHFARRDARWGWRR